MKKILLLGGSAQQVVAVKTAQQLGYSTVLCDYLTENPGQFVADKFYQISTTDKEAVLEVAKAENIDGVIAYASDPAAPTAAYVAEMLNLPTNPYQSVLTLCNKDKFREFLKIHGFHSPHAKGFSKKDDALKNLTEYQMPIIVKPVDSSGSKGITVLNTADSLEKAIDFAFSFSRYHRIIIEEFIEKKHRYLIGGDIFVADSEIILWGLMNCHRDTAVNPLVPVGKSYPLDLDARTEELVKVTLQKLVSCLGIKNGAINVELVVDQKNQVWPLDVGPRNGGNMIPDLLSQIFHVDMVEMSLRVAMGEKISIQNVSAEFYWATYNLHANREGTFVKINFALELEPYIIKKCIYKRKGDKVECFDNAAKVLGIVFLKFDSNNVLRNVMDRIDQLVEIVLLEDKTS